MSVNFKLINGLVFGIQHQYYMDFNKIKEEEMDFISAVENAPQSPMILIYIGPLLIIFS